MQSLTARSLLLRSSVKQTKTPATSARYVHSLRTPVSRLARLPGTAKNYRMAASIIQSAAATAHSAFASLASVAPVKAGDAVPDVEIKVNDLEDKVNFSKLPGKNVLVLVPGAFSPTCSSQVPSYLERYNDFKAKGVNDIYIVAVNDMFVVQAWGNKIAKDEGKQTLPVKFAGDDTGKLASSLGIVFDGQAVFGGPRFQRAALIIDSGKVLEVAVEKSPGNITVSHADELLKKL